tara:strand:- start:4029 stop:4760 length:732 start_codon:yes stop_codon:yes gene_type:complete
MTEIHSTIHPLTCVSGYWSVKNKHNNKYDSWFNNSLRINCPYIFFGDKDSIQFVKKFRRELPTYYIELNIADFRTFKFCDNMLIDKTHCPSIELNLIWNEKIFLIYKALQENPFSSEFFCWVDAGICIYRNKLPQKVIFPNYQKLNALPKDKLVYSSSTSNILNEKSFQKLPHVNHHVCGTSYLLHKNIIPSFVNLYETYMERLLTKKYLWTDQVIWTYIYQDYKDKFFKIGHGYGLVVPKLF